MRQIGTTGSLCMGGVREVGVLDQGTSGCKNSSRPSQHRLLLTRQMQNPVNECCCSSYGNCECDSGIGHPTRPAAHNDLCFVDQSLRRSGIGLVLFFGEICRTKVRPMEIGVHLEIGTPNFVLRSVIEDFFCGPYEIAACILLTVILVILGCQDGGLRLRLQSALRARNWRSCRVRSRLREEVI
jgi:hypothetical protein